VIRVIRVIQVTRMHARQNNEIFVEKFLGPDFARITRIAASFAAKINHLRLRGTWIITDLQQDHLDRCFTEPHASC
jgi:hypothetical protein